ncbi:MAG: hypothetical protein A3B62_05845 [Rhodospirillales bacterium RIFCSPLOWO2_01_FULL_65_14]|nr:MAG: hypothetical protein A3B62_05845 [Rhodospirillales bacterium RIFCSPLOWO2_01_FULL_65_14]
MGSALVKGQGVEKDQAEAAKWFAKAADKGDAAAEFELARMYEEGRGLPKDDKKALEWLKKAAADNHADAQILLGFYHEKGTGVEQDYTKALVWYRKANREKNDFAAKGIARIERDHPQAVQDLLEAEARQEAKRDLAFKLGLDALSTGDYKTAFEQWKPLAEAGDGPAQSQLGRFYAEGLGVEKNSGEALKWFKKATEQDEAVAQYGLGLLYEKGEGVNEDAAEAMKWFRRAAAQGYSRAEFKMGEAFERARGVPKDMAEAVKWYRRAAEQGLETAKERLALLDGGPPDVKPGGGEAPKAETPKAGASPVDLPSMEISPELPKSPAKKP